MTQNLNMTEPNRSVVFASEKNGTLRVWSDDESICDINPRDDVLAYEVVKQNSKEQIVEFDFYK